MRLQLGSDKSFVGYDYLFPCLYLACTSLKVASLWKFFIHLVLFRLLPLLEKEYAALFQNSYKWSIIHVSKPLR